MRRIACLAALIALTVPAQAQQQPPHAFLFGSWTGGIFPVPAHISAQACLAHPTVIFTQDVVLRATLTDFAYVQRQVESVRTGPITEFRFAHTEPPAADGLLGAITPPAPMGFGCASADDLIVQRVNDNQITFPGCADFPNPLVRCPSE